MTLSTFWTVHIAHPEEKWHNSKSTIFQEKQLNFFLIRVFKTKESETANTYVRKKGTRHIQFTSS
jgi:hypothetical protein